MLMYQDGSTGVRIVLEFSTILVVPVYLVPAHLSRMYIFFYNLKRPGNLINWPLLCELLWDASCITFVFFCMAGEK